jgi:hypothetical protein
VTFSAVTLDVDVVVVMANPYLTMIEPRSIPMPHAN